jgi:threonine-phosphate decarboxylase
MNANKCNGKIHQHGGDPASAFMRLGISERPVVDFSININPLGPPPDILAQWQDWHRDIGQYPTATAEPIKRFYEKQWAVSPDSVLPGNGSVSLMYLVLRALQLQRLAIVSPSFYDYARAAHAVGTKTIIHALSPDNGFAPLSPMSLSKALDTSDGLMLGHPNNPTGTLHSHSELSDLARRHPDKWILVDEAFIQFVDEYETKTLLIGHSLPENILIFHSLTKFYALPGLRLGAVIGHPGTIENLRRCQEPWAVNRIAERAAEALLNVASYEAETRQWIKNERHRLIPKLQNTESLCIFVPTANFVLAQWRATDNLDDLLRGLLEAGYHVRDCRNFAGLEQNYFRFAIRDSVENDKLIRTMTELAARYHV